MIQVAAAILVKDDKVFIARRSSKDTLPGKWEFPGGKLEIAETPEQCLHREMMEEFQVRIHIEGYFANSLFEYQGKEMELLGFTGKMLDERYLLNVHDEARWVDIKDLLIYDFASADIPFVNKLIAENSKSGLK